MRAVSLLLGGAAILALAAAVVGTGRWRDGMRMALDLLVAAGLVRLAVADTWEVIAGAGAVVVVRHLVAFGLLRGPGP